MKTKRKPKSVPKKLPIQRGRMQTGVHMEKVAQEGPQRATEGGDLTSKANSREIRLERKRSTKNPTQRRGESSSSDKS